MIAKVTSKTTTILAAAGVLLLSVLPYLPSLGNEFVTWDDNQYIYENYHIWRLDWHFLGWAFLKFQVSNWHPLTWVSHAIDYALWGLNPLGHRLTSILLHGINAFLVFVIAQHLIRLWRMREERREVTPHLSASSSIYAGIIASLLFSIHPLRVESVVWISERKDVLSGFFFLLGIFGYLRYVLEDNQVSQSSARFGFLKNRKYLLSLFFFLLALLSKPITLTLPIVLLLLDWYPLGRLAILRGRAVLEKLPFLLFSIVSAVVTVLAQRSGTSIISLADSSFWTRALVAFDAVRHYVVAFFWPFGLLPFYPYPAELSLLSLEYGISVLTVLGITAVCIVTSPKLRFLKAAWIYFLVTLFPVLGVVQVGNQSMADRYTYLPSIGLAVALGAAIGVIVQRLIRTYESRRKVHFGVTVLLLTIYAGLTAVTIHQSSFWKNGIVLWSHAIDGVSKGAKAYRNAYLAYHNRAVAYERSGLLDAAERDYRKVLDDKPDFVESRLNLGMIYFRQGDRDRAIRELEQILKIRPDSTETFSRLGYLYLHMNQPKRAADYYRAVLRVLPGNPDAHYSLGTIYLNQGRIDDAIREFELSVGSNPNIADVRTNLGIAYLSRGRLNEALREQRAAVSLVRDRAVYRINLGIVLMNLGRTQEAIREYRTALHLEPNQAEAHYQIGVAYQTAGQHSDSIRHFQTAIAANPSDARAQTNLGTAFLRVGENQKALQAYKVALTLDPESYLLRYNIGLTYERMGMTKDAVRAYQTALRYGPALSEAREALRRITGRPAP